MTDTYPSDDDVEVEVIDCAEHGPQVVLGVTTYTGFAGGRCTATTLACGHQLVDESADVEAAR